MEQREDKRWADTCQGRTHRLSANVVNLDSAHRGTSKGISTSGIESSYCHYLTTSMGRQINAHVTNTQYVRVIDEDTTRRIAG